MTDPHRSIFRAQAMRHYIQGQEKVILPCLVSPPVFVFCWILLGVLLSAGGIAWWGEIPTFIAGSGIILEQGSHSVPGHNEALVFLPANPPLRLHIGSPIQLQIGTASPRFTGQIERVEPGVLSPSAVCIRYALASSVWPLLTEPVVVVRVQLGPSIPAQLYAGSVVRAQVQVGSRRVLSLLPGLDRWIGDK